MVFLHNLGGFIFIITEPLGQSLIMQCSAKFGFIRFILHVSGKVTLFQAYLHLDNNPMDSWSKTSQTCLKYLFINHHIP